MTVFVMKWIGITGIILNTLYASVTGAALVIGLIFFGIGFGNQTHKRRPSHQPIWDKSQMMVTGTMAVVFMLFLLSSWNANLLVKQIFPGMVGGLIAPFILTDQLPAAAAVHIFWTLVSLYWLLPYVFDFKGISWKWQTIALGACGCSTAYGLLLMNS
ncbi:hypothetical protein [Paenibacillus sp. FSL R7-0652]|uniref:hypothetical protein n=1 Tax=Paenibacillus sp. FSL R7-0652 TaxID=2921687 RepID=UPI00315B3D9D